MPAGQRENLVLVPTVGAVWGGNQAGVSRPLAGVSPFLLGNQLTYVDGSGWTGLCPVYAGVGRQRMENSQPWKGELRNCFQIV